MKKFLLCLLIAGFLFAPVLNLTARNAVTYDQFNWQLIEVKIGNGGYELWYPERMQWFIPAAQAVVDEVYATYSQEFFSEFTWFDAVPSDTTIKNVYTRERLGMDNRPVLDTVLADTIITVHKSDTMTVHNWKDKNRAIFVYPSLQLFTQQKLSPGLMPPGVLGFNETMNWRVAVPYPGSYILFKNVMYHELAHAWMFQIMREACKRYKIPRGEIDRNLQLPLWFVEGFAETLNREFNQDYNQSYLAILRDDWMRRQICDVSMGVPALARMMGMDVYDFGHSFVTWIVNEYGKEALLEFVIQKVRYPTTEKAWEAVFGEKLAEMEEEWHQWVRYKYFQTVYADELKPSPEKVDKTLNCYGYASYDKGKVAYFAQDSKWGVRTEVKDLTSKQIWRLHHMFKDMSLWYRLDNTPSIKGNLVALTVNREGQDELHIYKLGKKKAKRVKLLRRKEILTINKPSFNKEGTKVVFEGIAPNGLSDLYIWNIETDKIERLSNDVYRDFNPCFANNGKLIVFASDRIAKERTALCGIWLETGKIVSFCQSDDKATFIDQPMISPTDDLIAFRLLTLDHSPKIFIWNRYKVYEVFSSFEGAGQIVGWEDKTTLLFLDRRGRLRRLSLENQVFPEFPAGFANISPTTWTMDEPDEVAELSPLKGWKYRYAFQMGANQPGFASTTGEEIFTFGLAGGGTMGGRSGVDIYYQIYASKVDLRSRLLKQYTIEAYRYFVYRSIEEHTKPNVVIDHTIRGHANFFYPLNLENGIGIGITSGWLKRTYRFEVNYDRWNPAKMISPNDSRNKRDKKESYLNFNDSFNQGWNPSVYFISESGPIAGSGLYFMHDRTFGNYAEVQRGSWLATQYNFLMMPNKLLEGYFMLDGRHYFQIFSTRLILANRIFYLKSFGKDRMITWSSDVHRRWNFPKAGTDLLQLQTEFRFPVLNWIAAQPAWMPIGSAGGIGVRVNGSVFWYAGDIWYANKGMEWTNRTGFSIKFMIMSKVSLQWEKYCYLRDGEWSRWKSGWFLNVDF